MGRHEEERKRGVGSVEEVESESPDTGTQEEQPPPPPDEDGDDKGVPHDPKNK